MSVDLEDKNEEILKMITIYVPFKTNSLSKEKYEEMMEDTVKRLIHFIKRNWGVLLAGDLNCREVNWETVETRGSETAWG